MSILKEKTTSSINVRIEDGSQLSLEAGASGRDLAQKIQNKLPATPLALRVNGKLRDLNAKLEDGSEISVITFLDSEGKKIFWHTSAHILAQAVLRLFPQAKPSIGPAIEEGFFYDFGDLILEETDLERIEDEINKLCQEKISIERIEYKDSKEACEVFKNNPFKMAIIEGKEETLSAYRQGDFLDLCSGPHLPNLKMVRSFKLLKTSGAYWRGDAKNAQLTRIYGISFPEKKMLKDYLHRQEEAKKRDHRILGSKLGLFSFHEEGPGMPFFHPRGMIIWNQLLSLMRRFHEKEDYLEIKTPIMLSQELWAKSGHWQNYSEHMYSVELENKQFAIKPMNCPGCMLYYKKHQYSYRQLPLRIAEFGHVHRHELSGALSGLFRVRSFHQDDAHIFMKPDDIRSEVLAVIRLAGEVYKVFGLEYHLELSTRPEKSIGSDKQWEQAISGLRDALEVSKCDFSVNEGDGAFYGPKIDFHIRDTIGRTWQCGTIQLDMSMPERFDLLYDTKSDLRERPILIHRAIYGSIERFFGILLEHFGGRFPLWLSPVQLRFITVADRHIELAKKYKKYFSDKNENGINGHGVDLRVDIDASLESISKKVRQAQNEQVNYIFVLGDKELERGMLSARMRDGKILAEKTPEELIFALQKEVYSYSLTPVF